MYYVTGPLYKDKFLPSIEAILVLSVVIFLIAIGPYLMSMCVIRPARVIAIVSVKIR